MKLPAKILRTLTNGSITKAGLRSLSKRWGMLEDFDQVFRELVDSGRIVKYGDRRGARWGLPTPHGPDIPPKPRPAGIRILSG